MLPSAAAPWAAAVGAEATGSHRPRAQAAAVARVLLRYDDARAGVVHDEEYEAVIAPLPTSTAALSPIVVDYDDRDLIAAAPPAPVTLVRTPAGQQDLLDHAAARSDRPPGRGKPLELLTNPVLKLYNRVGEVEAVPGSLCPGGTG